MTTRANPKALPNPERPRLGVVMLCGIAALELVCASAYAQAPSAAAIKADGSTIRMLINPSGSQSFPGFVIRKFGLDTKYGFKLQTIPTSTTQAAVVAMQSGSAEIGAWNWPDIARMALAGTKIVAIGPEMKWANTIVAPAASSIRAIPDLKGKKFGIVHRTGLDWIILRAFTRKKYGFDIQSAVSMQEGAVPLLRGLLEQGEIDASIMYNDYTPGMVASGKYRQIAKIKDLVDELGIPDSPYILFAARLDYAAAKPQNIRAFLAAYREAFDIMQTDDAVWVDAAKTLKIDDPGVVLLFRNQTRPLFARAFDGAIEAKIEKTFAVLSETGGPGLLGMSKLPENLITDKYQ